MVQYPEKKKNGRENVNAKKIKRQRASCAILKRKRNERERKRESSMLSKTDRAREKEKKQEGIALLSGIFRRIRDGIVACPVPMQS